MSRKPLPAVLAALCIGAPLVVGGSTASATPIPPTPQARADAAARQAPHEVVLDERDRLVARDVLTDADGTTHVRFDRVHAGLPVLGGDMVVHQAADGSLRGVSATARQRLQISLTPAVTAQHAERAARAAAKHGARSAQRAELQVDAAEAIPRLVWSVTVLGTQPDGTPSELRVLVDARTGRVVAQHEQIETVGDDQGRFVGTVDLTTTPTEGGFTLQDAVRGGQHTTDMQNGTAGTGVVFSSADDAWGGADTPREQVAVDAHYGAAQTLDYFKQAFDRSGIDKLGRTGFNRVHYGSSYNNAFWSNSCFCMTYGDGDGITYNAFTEIDVAGHEMTHGITASTANLTYSGESGGLNEASSDIFGTMVEHFANSLASDSPMAAEVDDPDYLVGEKLRVDGRPLRYMAKPSMDGKSADCWSRQVGKLDVHYSSGVGNHFFYLLANGGGEVGAPSPTCNGSVLGGIGKEAAAAVWYRALTVHMTSNTNYAGARIDTLTAARELEAAGTVPGNTDEAVAAAWTAVGVKAAGGKGNR